MHGVGQDRRARQINLLQNRIAHLSGQISTGSLDRRTDLIERLLNRLFEAELGRHSDRTVLNLGIDMLQPLQRCNGIFELAGNIRLELRWCRSGQNGRDRNGWEIQIREVLNLHRTKRQQAGNGQ